MTDSRLTTQTYRIADNGEWIKIAEGREERTGFYYVRGGRLSA
jgi:hypothetical protein